ncbi:uncharacterized protein LOC135123021 isoform X2 [Zophobas morio]|uniref:uncharacterized protein LOC135123021 isoform X2 n=1 Tax=Zophobas morio TaxID=2755281 RepID=UPI003083DA51
MDFNNLLRLFRNTVTGILDSEHQIEQEHVKEASSILNKFARLRLNDHEIKLFLDDVLRYFVLLNHYMAQFEEINASQQCTVRLGLGVFLFVLDSMHIYGKIIRKFQKIIDVITENNPRSFNIKEFLRIYSHLIDKNPVEVLSNLANKQKSLPLWYKIIKTTGDIETQAIIIEVVLKLFKSNKCTNVDDNFLEIIQAVDISSLDKSNMYQSIRMILDQLNEYSKNIFSINCSAIKLDSHRVVEFDGGVDDIWLDFNLLENRLSFFCDYNFVASKMKMFPTSATWEVLSFHARDVANLYFNYDSVTENLNMSFTISAPNINLSSDRFYDLVEHLPNVFPGGFSAEALGIPSKKELDSSRTPDISLVDSDGSSPIIEHFEMREKISAVDANAVFVELSDDGEGSVIVISDDDGNPPMKRMTKTVKVFNGSLKSSNKPRRISMMPSTFSKDTTRYTADKLGVIEMKTRKTACSQHNNKSNIFDKSVSPLSFAGSFFERRSRPQSRNSEIIENNFSKAMKISTTKIVEKKEKISTVKDKSVMKISSSLTSTIIKPYKEPEVKENEKHVAGNLEIEEKMMEATYAEMDLNASISKVEHWLKSVEVEVPLPVDDVEHVPAKIPESEDLVPSIGDRTPPNLSQNEDLPDVLPPVSEKSSSGPPKLSLNGDVRGLPDLLPSVSERGSSVPIEEKIERMMGQGENLNPSQDKSKVDGAACENTVEGLLSILCSQESKRREKSHERRNSVSKSVASVDSNMPLSELAKELRRNCEAKNTGDHGIEVEKDDSGKVARQSPAVDSVSSYGDVNDVDKITSEDLPVINNIENKELISKNRVTDVVNTEKISDIAAHERKIDQTPDVVERDIPLNNSLNITTDQVSAQSKAKPTRKLYNPEDLSYLNLSLTEYLQSKDSLNVTQNVIHIPSTPSRSKPTKPKTKKQKENRQEQTTGRKPVLKIIKTGAIKKPQSQLMMKSLNTLKETVRQQKKRLKGNQKPKRIMPSSSSSSSMEPFGVALSNLRKGKLKPLTVAKRPREENPTEVQEIQGNKIRIISDVVIQPAAVHPEVEKHSSEKCCCAQLVRMTSEFYLQFITHVSKTNPSLLSGDTHSCIVEILRGSVKS